MKLSLIVKWPVRVKEEVAEKETDGEKRVERVKYRVLANSADRLNNSEFEKKEEPENDDE